MGGLSRHFGTDASVDPKAQDALTDWLTRNAGGSRRAAAQPPQDRITQAAWFLREHRAIGATTFARPSIKSPAHCAACHPRAEQGDFDEHRVRIPG